MSRWITEEQKARLEAAQATLSSHNSTREDFKVLVQNMILIYADVLDAIVREEEGERDLKMSRKMNKTCRQSLKREKTSQKG